MSSFTAKRNNKVKSSSQEFGVTIAFLLLYFLGMMIRFTIFFLLGLGFSHFTKSAPPPEQTTSLIFAIPAFGIFILFLASLFSSGALIRSRINFSSFSSAENGLFDLATGTLAAYFLSYILTILGLFHSSQNYVAWLILSLFFALGSKNVTFKTWFNFKTTIIKKMWISIPLLIVVLKLLEGLQFHQHGDAYASSMSPARLWATSGSFQLLVQNPIYFFTTSWESLYAWGTLLMGLEGGHGLDLTQYFSQWVTGGIGLFGLILALNALAQRLIKDFNISEVWIPAIIIAGIQVPAIQWLQNLAKNDIGVIFWSISAYYFLLFLAEQSFLCSFLTGAFAGAAVIGKLNLGIFAICLGIGLMIYRRKFWYAFALGGCLGIAPVIIRNLVLVQSPLFPWLQSIFPGPQFGITFTRDLMKATHSSFQLDNIPFYFLEIIKQVLFLFTIIPFLFFRHTRVQTIKYLFIPLLALIGFTIFFRPTTEIRYHGPTLVLLALFSVFFGFLLLARIKKYSFLSQVIFSAVILAMSNITFFTFGQIGGKKFSVWSKQMDRLTEIGGPSKVWIRNNISTSKNILEMGDGHYYYLLDYQLTSYTMVKNLEQQIIDHASSAALANIQNSSFDSIYLNNSADYTEHRAAISEVMLTANQTWRNECRLYETPQAQFWDLHCVNQK